jgi:DNA-binding response OmpR family regulator
VRILVIEDNRLGRQALRSILEDEGHEVHVAANGTAAVALMSVFDPHVVITDWGIPGLSGKRLCREIRRQKPAVPMIILSSAAEAFSSAIDASVKLRKPLDVARLREVLAVHSVQGPERRELKRP